LELEANHMNTMNQLEQLEKRMTDTDLRLQNSEESRLKCFEDLSVLQDRYDDLQNNNMTLSRNAENLRLDLQKRKSTIHHQKKVIQKLDDTKSKIETSLKTEIAKQTIKLEEMEGKLKLTFVDKILFDTGKVEVKERGKELLLEIAVTLNEDKGHNISVEGHTDNVPIGKLLKERFPSNWELSAARAAAVVRFLQEESGLEPERLSASGYGYFRPVESNDTPEGRSQNRRIEIILVPVR
jgi:chemotaxis protein MotB